MPDTYYPLLRYPSAPVWHMGPAAWVAGTGIARWGMPDLSIPYANNIDADAFSSAFTRRTTFYHYARPVIIIVP